MARPANTSVQQLLRKKILSGAFEKTSFLPPERQLAQEYQVGRAIIRGALRCLGEQELIYKVPKRGWRLKEREERRLKRIILRLPDRMNAEGYEGMGLVAGICSGANDIYAEVILSSPPMHLEKKELLERFNAGEIQGIIFLESAPDISIRALADSGIPCVIANLEEELDLPCVRMDYRAIGRMAGAELLKRGHKNIAVCSGDLKHFIYRELLAGFRGALAEENIFLKSENIICGGKEELSLPLRRLLERPGRERPDAIFTLRDYRAGAIYELCAELGLRIPEDVGLISYDNISWPAAPRQGVTTINEDVYRIGKEAVRMVQKMYESNCADIENCTIPGVLVPRRSLSNSFTSGKK